jgi:hypothetical protein
LFEGTEGAYTILSALEQAVRAKLVTSGQLKITGSERMLLSVMALLREVNNGGYDQFFRNSSRQYAPAIVRDLTGIGCSEVADITQQALDSLNLANLTVAAIEVAMATESADAAIQPCL